MTRGVEKIEDAVAVGELQNSGGNGDAALAFHLHPVRGGGATIATSLHSATGLNGARIEKELLGEGGFARVRVRNDGKGTPRGSFAQDLGGFGHSSILRGSPHIA